VISRDGSAGIPFAPAETGGPPCDPDRGRTSAPAECVGPLAVPAEVMHRVAAVAQSAGADDFLPLAICASVLVGRLSRPGSPRRARLVRGAREMIAVAADGPCDSSGSLRAALRRSADIRVVSVPDTDEPQPVDVTILLSPDGERLYAESMTSAADAPLAECWARSFLKLLAAMANAPDSPLASHRLVEAADRDRILHGLNPYHRPVVRHRTLTEPFEEQVERSPTAVACVDDDGAALSYRDLNEQANRLARFLIEGGAGPDTRIGICMERGIDQIVAIYAAVKTGAAYVPLDAELPDTRLRYMLDDAAPVHVLTDRTCRDRIPGGPWRVHDVESDRAAYHGYAASNPVVGGTAANLLHILYTSGTTGRPKGVAYPTDAALVHLAWMQSRYPFSPGDTALFKTSPGFDVSVWEIFWPLQHGARLVVCRPGGHRDPKHLARLVERYDVTTIFLAPTVMRPFLDEVSADRAGALRWALCGGEPVTPRIRDTFHATLPKTTLLNCYGPTEAGCVTDMVLDPEPGAPVPLGRPADNFRLTLLDDQLELVPIGMPGEAYIGGSTGLAQAYWRAPGRTAERFVADPYGPAGSRMYRTGDLCRYRDDGVLEHLGRIDRQIKVRGQRIEPGEIESVLTAHPAVADCAVVAQGDPVRILAFVVPTDRTVIDGLDVAGVLAHATATLPLHMRPEQVIPVLRIPATVNGKIDTEALLHLWHALSDREREVVPPADDLEARLVEIYGRVLRTGPVSVLDTFTDLGGHSLLAFAVLDECLATLQIQPGVTELLTGTIRDVAASIRRAFT
jgi:amino acid adenylation domain-containing protein